MNSDLEAVYYESKTHYYIITILLVLFFSYLTLFNYNNLREMMQYLLGISILAFFFVYFYQTSTFYIYKDGFVWKKGGNETEYSWEDILAIHYDPRSKTRPPFGYFESTSSFFLETKKGLTKYISKSNIQRKGSYTYYSKAQEFISLIKDKSNCSEQRGAISIFQQTQKLWDWVLLILGIFIVPIIIILLYGLFT